MLTLFLPLNLVNLKKPLTLAYKRKTALF